MKTSKPSAYQKLKSEYLTLLKQHSELNSDMVSVKKELRRVKALLDKADGRFDGSVELFFQLLDRVSIKRGED